MHTVILDTMQQNSRRISDFISEKYPGWNVNAYPTTFALATAVYDEFKEDLELHILDLILTFSLKLQSKNTFLFNLHHVMRLKATQMM
mgnify:CR=1 FL=1